jgi:hypothetical protein
MSLKRYPKIIISCQKKASNFACDVCPSYENVTVQYYEFPPRAGMRLLCSIMSAAWIYVQRKLHVLRVSQPLFLYLIAFGTAVHTSMIVTTSNDESYGWRTNALSSSCMASAWLLSFGTIIIYATLLTKLWCVNEVLQLSRRMVLIRLVSGPVLAVVLAAYLS